MTNEPLYNEKFETWPNSCDLFYRFAGLTMEPNITEGKLVG
jgi:hypothetical protein